MENSSGVYQIPDIVTVHDKNVCIFELTVPFELNIDTNRYAGLVSDIESVGYKCFSMQLKLESVAISIKLMKTNHF